MRWPPGTWRRCACAAGVILLLVTSCMHMPKVPRIIPKGKVADHASTAGTASKTISAATEKIMKAQIAIQAAAAKVGERIPEARPETDRIIVHAEDSTNEAANIDGATLLLNELQRDLQKLSASVTALEGEKADLAAALEDKNAELLKAQEESEIKRQKMYRALTFGLIGLGAVILAVGLGYLRNMPAAATGGILMASGMAMWALQPYLPWIVGGTIAMVLIPYVYQLYDHDRHRCALEEQVMNEDPTVDHAVKSRKTEELVENIRHKAKHKFRLSGTL